tara:strand:+ start:2217 stop:2762 length:546 start_codon:yes stop_codon:yes gene_type:complete
MGYPDFTANNYTIPGGTLSKDGEQIILRTSFIKPDTRGIWYVPQVYLNGSIASQQYWTSVNNPIHLIMQFPYVAKFEMVITRVTSNKVVVTSHIRLGNLTAINAPAVQDTITAGTYDPPTWHGPEANYRSYSRFEVTNLDLDISDYVVDYKVAGIQSGAKRDGLASMYMQELLIEKIDNKI